MVGVPARRQAGISRICCPMRSTASRRISHGPTMNEMKSAVSVAAAVRNVM
jgi:hypothetical protein